jgi:hypothetical protein
VSSGPVPRIFVVDDEHVIAATLATILHMNGSSARFFTDPVEARLPDWTLPIYWYRMSQCRAFPALISRSK